MEISTTLLCFLCLLWVAYTLAMSGDNCPRYVRRMKPTGEYYQVFENNCCPDYMEVDKKCIACPPGLFGQNCSLGCIENNYGPQCKQVCKCQKHQICNKHIGCTCKAGFTGDKCDTDCPPGLMGHNCSLECIGNRYGPKCKHGCVCLPHQICNKQIGCTCRPGFTGNKCDTVCSGGFYGLNCTELCFCSANANSTCNSVDGKCKCNDGWMGQRCDEPCTPGTFGANCAEICSCSQCNPATGSCLEPLKDSPQMGLIVGAGGGSVAVVILGVLLAFVIYRSRHESQNNEHMKTSGKHSFNSNRFRYE